MPNPLFRNFQARRKAAASAAKTAAKSAARRAASSPEGRAIASSAREVRSQASKLIDVAAKQLGKVGSLLKALLRIGGAKPEESLEVLNQAAREAGRQPVTVSQTPPKPTQRPKPKPQSSARGKSPKSPSVTFREAPGPEREPNVYEVMLGGRRRKYSPDDPTISGEMLNVQSSNVHSFGFIFNWDNPMQGTLKVRFLQGSKESKTAGPLYYYFNVHPDVFEAFQRAGSPGGFVWDRLRIRGTVAGHQYKYQLAGISGGYVPRQAKQYGQNQYFVQRRFKGTRNGEIRTFESELPDQSVGRYEPQRGQPSRGLPNRGTPNRGS